MASRQARTWEIQDTAVLGIIGPWDPYLCEKRYNPLHESVPARPRKAKDRHLPCDPVGWLGEMKYFA